MFAIIEKDTRNIQIETTSRIFCLFEFEKEALDYLENIPYSRKENLVVMETEVTFKRVKR